MKLDFTVGIQEQHHVEFEFDQMVGNLKITVDGNSVVKDLRMFSLSLVKRYEFDVGVREQHKVAIEKERKLLLRVCARRSTACLWTASSSRATRAEP